MKKQILNIIQAIGRVVMLAPAMLVFENENPAITLVGLAYIAALVAVRHYTKRRYFVESRISATRADIQSAKPPTFSGYTEVHYCDTRSWGTWVASDVAPATESPTRGVTSRDTGAILSEL